MAKLCVHSMTEDDLPCVEAIENDIYEFPWTVRNFKDSIQSGYRAVVLRLDDALVGYAVLMFAMDECHLLNISVARNAQGQGWGKFLLDWCLQDARGRGCTGFLLEVRPSNAAARHVYDKKGFKLIGVRKNYYPAQNGREDALVMFKSLTMLDTAL